MPRRKLTTFLAGLAVALFAGAAVMGTVVWHWTNTAASPTTPANSIHGAYGELYDASWRSDQATGNTVMTATIFSPGLRSLLAQDTERSDTDTQIAAAIQNVPAGDVPVVVTLDTVASDSTSQTTDEAVRKSLTFSGRDLTATSVSVTALVPPLQKDTNVDHPIATTSRIWVAVFHPTTVINWQDVKDLQLVVQDIGGIPKRTFTWAAGIMVTTP